MARKKRVRIDTVAACNSFCNWAGVKASASATPRALAVSWVMVSSAELKRLVASEVARLLACRAGAPSSDTVAMAPAKAGLAMAWGKELAKPARPVLLALIAISAPVPLLAWLDDTPEEAARWAASRCCLGANESTEDWRMGRAATRVAAS